MPALERASHGREQPGHRRWGTVPRDFTWVAPGWFVLSWSSECVRSRWITSDLTVEASGRIESRWIMKPDPTVEAQLRMEMVTGNPNGSRKAGTIEVPEQAVEVKEETLPSWWAGQKEELKGRIQTLKERMTKNRGYLQRILQLVNQAVEEKDSPHEHEKYTFQPNEPGILAFKPVGFTGHQTVNPKLQKENPMDSFSEIKGEGDEHVDIRNYFKNPFGNTSSVLPRPKLELPMFDGNNSRGWIRKCQIFFNLFGIPEEQKLEIAAMYLTGRDETWFDGYIMQKHRATWYEFEADLCHRFGDKNYSDIIEEFNKLMQKGSVEEYQDNFEELKPYLLQQNMYLGEDYFVSSFVSSLKEELKHKVKVLEPKTLSEAYRQAKIYELANEIETKRYKVHTRSFAYTSQNIQPKNLNTGLVTKTSPLNSNITQSLVEYRRTHNLCFKCGEKFTPGHQCKVRQLNCMEEEEESAEKGITEEEAGEKEDTEKETLEISINVITGNVGHTTLRIQGFIKGKPLNILIDSGSTHSFVTPKWAKEGMKLVNTQPLVITVANREKLYSNAKCNKVSWKMQGYEFQHDFRVLSLGGSDMDKTISFMKDGKNVVIRGTKKLPLVRSITGEKFQKLALKDTEMTGEIFWLSAEVADSITPQPLEKLLEEFSEIFEDPKEIPSKRKHDHAIITDMLAASIIQVSQSSFSSHCLLIKKKDGSWRFCVDYRQLNSITIKNKFIIPIVEYLLDELNRGAFFSKIDLRSGYWQIRIKDEDIHKTVFRTHQGHYEFKVIPFGLTNAPATFQALMNDLFGAYLRKFVLMFFDDILVYSPNFAAHEQHLRVVLNILLENKLYAKRSKCFFGQSQVEYLGHLISAQGVATDPAKIKAMQQWPLPKNLKALRGFLGFTGYYRKFIKGYGELSKPLNNMLKKEGFYWSPEAVEAFEELKQVMCRYPVLALPNFEKFCLETNASSKGTGEVLSQEGRPIAYLSKALRPKHADLSIYENEYLTILMAVSHWRHYLENEPFVIKTDHEPLKHLLEHKLTTTIQKKELNKLLGLDYTIQYRKGKHNKVTYALSRQQEDSGEFFQIGIIVITLTWMQDIEQSYQDDALAQEKIHMLVLQPKSIEDWKLVKGVLYFKNKAYVGSKGDLREKIIIALNDSSIGGHSVHSNEKIGKGRVPSIDPPEITNDGQLKVYPASVLNKWMVKHQNQAVTHLLIQWTNMGLAEATWEYYSTLKTQFLDFDPWGQGSSGGGSIVMMEEELGLEKGEIGRKLPQLGILNEE
ncbi:uncharacterized protein LOC120207396 [Hibiscus syriacus]|uniref:uncharacterized protein LOC120207396 n=1 Tax=Hibiscus syriacus TaxID=106335 RepID=UPI0019224367|nr:uncharacterized protein LOC120207396 [Hibiscus syriacus]